jgi:hypothetical protein
MALIIEATGTMITSGLIVTGTTTIETAAIIGTTASVADQLLLVGLQELQQRADFVLQLPQRLKQQL